jgi:flavin reductase (DIM6/NTAB) family NADH-FMN oxidoreductase RutF
LANDQTDEIFRALGRLPSGLYIATAARGEKRTGMLASWVQQAGFLPPSLTVAVARQRFFIDWVAEAGGFTLNQVASGRKSLLKHFSRGFDPADDAFEGLDLIDTPEAAGPVLADSMAYLDCRTKGSMDSGDHRIFLAEIVGGRLIDRTSEPFVHVRKSGMTY